MRELCGKVHFVWIDICPVEIHTASKDNTLPLHMLDSRDFSPIGYRHITDDRKGGDWSHIVKAMSTRRRFCRPRGWRFQTRHVKASETIEIDTFCDASQFRRCITRNRITWLRQKAADKVYTLLQRVLESPARSRLRHS